MSTYTADDPDGSEAVAFAADCRTKKTKAFSRDFSDLASAARQHWLSLSNLPNRQADTPKMVSLFDWAADLNLRVCMPLHKATLSIEVTAV